MMPGFRKLTIRHGLYIVLVSLAVLVIFGPVRAQGSGPVPSIDRVEVPPTFEAGQPFDVDVWATNNGDTANGGSITLSLPEGYTLSIVNPDTPSSTPAESLCDKNFDHTWAISPGGACSTVLLNNTACRGKDTIRYPMAESSVCLMAFRRAASSIRAYFPGWGCSSGDRLCSRCYAGLWGNL